MSEDPVDLELARYMKYLGMEEEDNTGQSATTLEELRTTPLFSWQINKHAQTLACNPPPECDPIFSQYGLLGKRLINRNQNGHADHKIALFLNTNAPWSAFICGSQGSGKSYTLSCILENCLLRDEEIGETANPLSGLLFYYDPRPSESICEAAYLASHIQVKVLVSPSNYYNMKNLYRRKISNNKNLTIAPLLFSQGNLNTDRILKLMAFNDRETAAPLYLEVMMGILRDMALEAKGASSFDYRRFRNRLSTEKLAAGQQSPLNLRLQLLDSFLNVGEVAAKLGMGKVNLFESEPGMLTIVDLTDPFVDTSTACTLFDMCLSLFLEDGGAHGSIIALDEAHKFMNGSVSADAFTDTLLTTIREQRHKAARVVIATQEPTISPKLLDLCSMTFVHRFTSPEWFLTLKSHIAAASACPAPNKSKTSADEGCCGQQGVGEEQGQDDLFDQIINLSAGQSLLFSPSAILDVTEDKQIQKLGRSYIKFKTRTRVTADGGQSIMATPRKGNNKAAQLV